MDLDQLDLTLRMINSEFNRVERFCKGSKETFKRHFGTAWVSMVYGMWSVSSSPAFKQCCIALYNKRIKDLYTILT